MKKLLTIALVLAMILSTVCFAHAEEEKPQYDVTYVSVWAGSSSGFPADVKDNPVANIIKEKFGLSFTFEGITTSETEYLNMMFAAGTTPDLVNAPFWGTTGGEGYVIAKAASEGQIKDLTDILEADYPEIYNNWETYVGPAVKEYMLGDVRFGGRIYVLPSGIGVVSEDKLNLFGDAMYARKDVLDAIGVKPEDVVTMDDLYNLLVKIKEAGLTDWNGEPMIPMCTNHNGWRQENIYQWAEGDYISSYRQAEDGSVYYYLFGKEVEDRVLYLRKLVSEGLIDIECFTQNNSLAQEKFAQGKGAVAPIDANLAPNLYYDYSVPDHPEAEWVLLGMKTASGNPTVDVYSTGVYTGGGALFFSPNIDEGKLRALLDLFYWNQTTEEGVLLTNYGIEGEDYTMENGYPEQTEAFRAAVAADPKYSQNRGIGQYNWCMLKFDSMWWPIPTSALPERTQMAEAFKESVRWARAEHTYDKISVNYLAASAPAYELFTDMSSSVDVGAMLQSAYFVATDEEALAIVEEARQQMLIAGVEDVCTYIAENFDPDKFMF